MKVRPGGDKEVRKWVPSLRREEMRRIVGSHVLKMNEILEKYGRITFLREFVDKG